MKTPQPAERRADRHRSAERLDPSFVRRLEDDGLWQQRQSRPVRVRPPQRERRQRLVAIVAFVIVLVVVIVIGVVAAGGDPGSGGGGAASPFSLLPLPSGPVAPTTGSEDSSSIDLTGGTSTPPATVGSVVRVGD